MPESAKILKLRTLLTFVAGEETSDNVTGISKTLGVEKYTISRILKELEEEGLVNRQNPRKPVLTVAGEKKAYAYRKRLDESVEYLLDANVNPADAVRDALYWTLFNSEDTAEFISESYRISNMKKSVADKRSFHGGALCENGFKGNYRFPFVLYRKKVKYGNNLSMSNRGFKNPCNVIISDGRGIVQIEAKSIGMRSGFNERAPEFTDNIKYMSGGVYHNAEKHGRIFSFPINALEFTSFGQGENLVIHGHTELRFEFARTRVHEIEAEAIFVLII